eukprot:3084869-Rhodomonas_salina.2
MPAVQCHTFLGLSLAPECRTLRHFIYAATTYKFLRFDNLLSSKKRVPPQEYEAPREAVCPYIKIRQLAQ